MKFQADDPRLSAYLFGELSPEEARRLEHAAAADPALGLSLRELASTHELFERAFATGAASLLPRQRELILRQARAADEVVSAGSRHQVRHPGWWKRALPPLAAAAVIALAGWLTISIPDRKSRETATNHSQPPLPLEIALFPASGPLQTENPVPTPVASVGTGAALPVDAVRARDRGLADGGDPFLRRVAAALANAPRESPEHLPPLVCRSAIAPSEMPSLPLPMQAGSMSPRWIEHAIRHENRVPRPDAVRLEELLNSLDLAPVATSEDATAIAANGSALRCELIRSPWMPSQHLLFIQLLAPPERATDLRATFNPDPATVGKFRLLGYESTARADAAALPPRLAAGRSILLAIELELTTAADPEIIRSLGTISWSADQLPAPDLAISAPSVLPTPSDDARFAALVCATARWWRADSAETIDAEIVAALARELASKPLTPVRESFLSLVDSAIQLAD